MLFKFFPFMIIIIYTINEPWTLGDSCLLDEVHAIVLARGGSKGIKHKNLVEINGLSLLARTLVTLRNSQSFTHIWVSTDSAPIEREAIKYGALVHRRAEFYAQDNTSSLQSIEEFLTRHTAIRRFALFQCTSVFLKERYIHEAFDLFATSDCVFSVTRSHKLRWRFDGSGVLKPVNFKAEFRPRRQDWSGEFVENGMFYFSSRSLVDKGHFQNDKCSIVEIDPEDSHEIDHINDVHLAKCLMNLRTTLI